MDAFDVLILILRIGFIFLLYFFLFLVVRVITRELDNAKYRSSLASPNYPEESDSIKQGVVVEASSGIGRVLVTEIGSATTVRVGAIFELSPITPIGRRATNAIRLDDDLVSGEHALLSWREGRWYLSDNGSTNGTYLNGEAVLQPRLLNWGDLIGIGRVRLRLEP